MPVLKPPNSASLFTFRAAQWATQVNTGTEESPVWAWLRGLSKFEPVQDPTLQDDSDIDSEGYKSELVTAQKLNINAEGMVKGEKSLSTVTPDPGTAFLRAKGKQIGYDNIVQIRYWRTDDLPEAFSHFFAVKWTDVGGSNEDLQKFTATLSGRGKPEAISKPQAPETATDIDVSPNAVTLDVGETVQLVVLDDNGVNRTAEAEFTSGNPARATVSPTGLVTAVATGSAATITVEVGALSDTCAVTVA